jgi:hypothetical protein
MSRLRPGNLPGYTGWPVLPTLAGSLMPICDGGGADRAEVTRTVPAITQCQHGGSLSFIYGPAILPGIAPPANGSYDVTFLPFDQGLYTVEVVLAFPALTGATLSCKKNQPIGRISAALLPALHVNVGNQLLLQTLPCPFSSKIKHSCNMSMLTETSTHSALASGRCGAQDEYAHTYVANKSSSPAGHLAKVSMGETSLGV